MRTRVGINGMGRIGLRYDSTYGPWPVHVQADDRHLQVGEHLLRVFDHARPEDIDWRLAEVEIVIEATGQRWLQV